LDRPACDEPQHLQLARGQVLELARRRLSRPTRGVLLDQPPRDRRRDGEAYAITGGTGAYVGASGTMTRRGNGKKDTLTFTLE
jgi:hypothetical protein